MARIKVNALPNPKGSVFSFALWGTILSVGGGIIGLIPYFYSDIGSDTGKNLEILSTIINLTGIILIFIFFNYFTNACKVLGNKVIKDVGSLFGFFVGLQIFVMIFNFLPIDFNRFTFWKIFVITPILILIYFLKVANNFRYNYFGLLHETGRLMMKYLGCVVLLIVVCLSLVVIYLFDQENSISSYGEFQFNKNVIIGVLLILPFVIWTWVVWTKLICTMDELMERGYRAWCYGARKIGSGAEEVELESTGIDQKGDSKLFMMGVGVLSAIFLFLIFCLFRIK